MYVGDLETTLKVWTVDLLDSVLNVIYFSILIILFVANIIFPDMVLRSTMPLMRIRPQNRVILLYISRIPLGTFGTMIGSTPWTL